MVKAAAAAAAPPAADAPGAALSALLALLCPPLPVGGAVALVVALAGLLLRALALLSPVIVPAVIGAVWTLLQRGERDAALTLAAASGAALLLADAVARGAAAASAEEARGAVTPRTVRDVLPGECSAQCNAYVDWRLEWQGSRVPKGLRA